MIPDNKVIHMDPKIMTDREAFVAIKDLLLEKGWGRGTYYHLPDGLEENNANASELATQTPPEAFDFCLEGAIGRVCGHLPAVHVSVVRKVEEMLDPFAISEWNDDPDRSQEDVFALLKNLIAAEPVWKVRPVKEVTR